MMNPTLLLILSILLFTEGLVQMFQGRIIGGHSADVSDIPSLVSIHLNDGFECAGTLISSRWILTAADCINYGFRCSVRANSSYVDASGQLVGVQSIVVHPKYSRHDNDYNFALLELDLNLNLKVAKLPNSNDFLDAGTILQVFGWGTSSNTWNYQLNAGNLSVIDRDECQELLCDEYGSISERSFCAASAYGGVDTLSYGDSGSPVVLRGDDGEQLIVGVASGGYGRCREAVSYTYPGIFGWVSAVIDWIEATLKG